VVVKDVLFETTVRHPIGIGDYLTLTWFATSLATVAGALGSGLESEDDVRKAAYGFRQERRAGDEPADEGD
jgi:hypothetical protein